MRAVFLDRDGVINDNEQHVNKPADLILYPGVGESIRKLNEAGYHVFVVTNQGGVGSGFMTELMLKAIHSKMEENLGRCGAIITEIVACTHHPKAGCECRKPRPGMVTALVAKHNIDASSSWLVGDMGTDCQAGKAAGVGKCVMLRGQSEFADFTAADLVEAVSIILGGLNHEL